MFIELKGAAFRGLTEDALKGMTRAQKTSKFGKYFDDKGRIKPNQDDFQQGKILEGPADFVGRKITGVDAGEWEKLTPEKTKQAFSRVKADKNGISALKSSIRRAIKDPNDTRLKRLRTAKTVESLVPLARISGFKDDEIKRILTSGKPSTNTVESLTVQSSGKKPYRLTPTGGSQAEQGAAAVQLDEAFDIGEGKQTRPEALKSILENLKESRDDEDFKKEIDKLLNRLKVSSPGETDDIANKAIKVVEDQIKSSEPDKKLKPAPDEKSRLKEDRQATKESIENDRKAVQSAAKSLESDQALDEVAKEHLDAVAGDMEKAREAAIEAVIGQLEKTVRLPQVKREVARVKKAVASGTMTRSGALFLLLQILRLILTLLVPA